MSDIILWFWLVVSWGILALWVWRIESRLDKIIKHLGIDKDAK